MKAWFVGFACLLVLAVITGCGPTNPATVPVSGVVTYQGEPVVGAQVSFMAEGAARAASGQTDAQGKFQLSTYGTNDGAVVGSHTVTIAKATDESIGGAGMSPDDPDGGYAAAMAQASQQATTKSALPEKYGNPKESGLTAAVTQAGPNDFTFALE
jgi:predicted small lipoprotein YifL